MKAAIAVLIIALAGVFLHTTGICALAIDVREPVEEIGNQPAPWKQEFERLCAQTQIAASLSAEQLRKLIADSDELLERLGHVEDPQAKVYIFRLRNCREFFAYALDLQERGE